MNHGLSDQVREAAKAGYVVRAAATGKRAFSIPVREVLRALESDGFPPNHARQVCTALTSGKFLRENGLKIEAVDGPPSKSSATVVVHYRFAPTHMQTSEARPEPAAGSGASPEETPEERAHRLTGKLWGLLREEITAMGGAEKFIRWVRSEDEDDAAEHAA